LNQIKQDYEALIENIQNKFNSYIQDIELAYEELENESKQKD